MKDEVLKLIADARAAGFSCSSSDDQTRIDLTPFQWVTILHDTGRAYSHYKNLNMTDPIVTALSGLESIRSALFFAEDEQEVKP